MRKTMSLANRKEEKCWEIKGWFMKSTFVLAGLAGWFYFISFVMGFLSAFS